MGLSQLQTVRWGAIVKRISQTGIAIYNVFFGPIPVPIPLTVWPRVVIAIAIVVSVPFLTLVHSRKWRIWVTIGALVLILCSGAAGIEYWMMLPTRTLAVRGDRYIGGEPTEETKKMLVKFDTSLPQYIDGNPHRDVDEFLTPDSVRDNKIHLAMYYIVFLACGTIGILILLEWIPGGQTTKQTKHTNVKSASHGNSTLG